MPVTNAAALPLHKTKHQDGGPDEVSVAALSGELADRQPSKAGTSVLGWTNLKLLRGAGAGVAPGEIDVPTFDFFNRYRDFVEWSSFDGCAIGGDAGYTIQPRATTAMLQTGATVDNDAWVYTNEPFNLPLAAGKLVIWDFYIIYASSPSTATTWVRLSKTPISDPPDEVAAHMGWKIINADISASNADGATQTITDTLSDLSVGWQMTMFRIVLNPGTDIKFYVNNVLKVTHNTNLPTAGQFMAHLHIRTSAAATRQICVSRIWVEREL